MVNGFTIKFSVFSAALLLLSTPLHALQTAPLIVGMTREQVLDLRGAPHSKVEMETARIEKWHFSYHEVLVFKEGKLVGTQDPHILYSVRSPQIKFGPKVSPVAAKEKKRTFDTSAVFKEIEGISEPDGIASSPPAGISQNGRPMTAPHPAREVEGTDDGEG